MRRLLLAALVFMMAASCLQAGTIVLTWPEQNGPDFPGLPYTLDAGSQSYTIPAGETILSAVFTSSLGNSVINSTAVMDVFVNGVLVGTCPNQAAPCWLGGGPYPFTYNFLAGELSALAGGSADLTVTQYECCAIRLGASELTITTGSAVPEPATLWLLGLGLCSAGFVSRRLRRR
jgi:hypothetical protein